MTWFDPADVPWTYASRRLIPARLSLVVLGAVVALVVVLRNARGMGAALWFVVAGIAVATGWLVWLVWRQVTAHAWAEREDDLIVKRGRLFRSVTVVPYGRMQYVEVSAGPVARALGIARVQLHTASPGTDAHLSGVPADEAARLRDRLTTRGEARLAGL
ncbi:MAG: PH domain-containing protein [Actinomycetes bacterium]